MPSAATIRKRGGVVRIRTVMIDGKPAKVYVMRKPGPNGGRTIVVRD